MILQELAEKTRSNRYKSLSPAIRTNDVIAIPKAVQEQHVIENAEAATIEFTEEDLKKLDEAFPKHRKKMPFDLIEKNSIPEFF
jgi:diketogulonate reductase-like aldo/keto reductase